MINDGQVTVYVSDMDRAVKFYTDSLGLPLLHRAGDHYAQVRAGGLVIGLHPCGEKSPKPAAPGSMHIGFSSSESIEAEVERLEAKGVSFCGPIANDGPVKLASFADPDGNGLYLAESRKAN
jgi:catechol 2,3-dioxygenase-like lactoylglutathione lyase family enzyme